MMWNSIQLDKDRPASLQRLKQMRGAPVHILRGPYGESHGIIKTVRFDATIQNTIYTILIAGVEEEFSATIPAPDCAIYYPVGHRVRVIMGTYTGKRGYVTSCSYNVAERFYEIRICMSADQFEVWAETPYDIHETFPASMLAPAAGL